MNIQHRNVILKFKMSILKLEKFPKILKNIFFFEKLLFYGEC